MLLPIAALLLQVVTPAPTPSRDTSRAARTERDSSTEMHGDRRKTARRDSLTAEHLATAYASPSAREILALARRARAAQDSSLQSYDASTYQRISAGLALTALMRDRLAFRTEGASRVRWRRGVGAYVEVTGARSVVPIGGRGARAHVGVDISPIPYYPGSETLLIGVGRLWKDMDENEGFIHPLAAGAEASFTYEAGDSVSFRLPGGRTIELRELRVRPRAPRWDLAVGSLWFDMSGGQLVRAAYRMSSPMDIQAVALEDDPHAFDEVPAAIKPMLFPMTAQVSAIGVEYGLYQGRFWLPRLQVIEGSARMGPVRSPFKVEQRYDYSDVNAGAPLPPIPPATAGSRRSDDSSVEIGMGDDEPHTARDSARARRRAAACDSSGMRSVRRRGGDSLNPVFITTPCDAARLASSPDLPRSIYDDDDEAFPREELDALVQQALSMGAQAGWAPQRPVARWETLRYNRIEGLSGGASADQQLGEGYSLHALGRLGLADLQPVAELTLARSDLRRTIAVTGYNRLVPASEYGNPMSLGSSLSALLFARDEAYYYRASGIELISTPEQPGGALVTWGLFAEQQRGAPRRTTFAIARGATGFVFDTNLVATRGLYYGARSAVATTFGQNPAGFRLYGDMKLEAARGDTGTYGRVALDLTLSHPVPTGAAALSFAGGTSAGVLPVQRNWFIGGSQTVRGQRAALEPGRMGDAFWLARAELARGTGVVRPILFGDVGWAGDRTRWREIGRPISGAGVGASVMDGLVRVDVARGIWPERGWRLYTYFEGRI